jgi:hypothetical protein
LPTFNNDTERNRKIAEGSLVGIGERLSRFLVHQLRDRTNFFQPVADGYTQHALNPGTEIKPRSVYDTAGLDSAGTGQAQRFGSDSKLFSVTAEQAGRICSDGFGDFHQNSIEEIIE